MERKPIFKGAASAIITPMNENGVDYESFRKLLNWQIEEGIDALVIAGTSGEGSTLTDEEHRAAISFAVDYALDRDSIYTKQLRMRGELLTHDKDQSAFVFMKLEELMETDFIRIKENMTLGDIVHIISSARRNIFPVIDNFGRLLGVVQLDDLREDMFKQDKWGRSITHYMIQPPYKILEHELVQSILPRFEENNTWMLPVVDRENRYLGFISKSRILNAYREALVKISQ